MPASGGIGTVTLAMNLTLSFRDYVPVPRKLAVPASPLFSGRGRFSVRMMDPPMTVLIYVDTGKQIGDPEHLKVFANADAAAAWFAETIPKAWPLSTSFWTVRLEARTLLEGRDFQMARAAHPGVQFIQSKVQLIARNVATPKKETQVRVVRSVTRPNVTG